MKIILPLIVTTLLLAGCGGRMSGTYKGNIEVGMLPITLEVEFKSGGKALVRLLGQGKEGTYKVEGDVIRLTMPTGDFMEFKKEGNALVPLQGSGKLVKKG